ncbi:hypothetical protein MPSEU_000549600 [Mayamaea pseudoterrestris]|nr:hypothetical protein MPSEU_000549600 [Mayamaea pseudoterrestris]
MIFPRHAFHRIFVIWHLIITHLAAVKAASSATKVVLLVGDDACLGHANVKELQQSLQNSAELHEKYLYVLKDENSTDFVVRDDVRVVRDDGDSTTATMSSLALTPLIVGLGATADTFGPELGLGHLLGNVYQQDVLIVKLAYQNATLGIDFRAPTMMKSQRNNESLISGGPLYQRLLRTIGYFSSQSREYEMIGMVWWHGYSDYMIPSLRLDYRRNLQQLVRVIQQEWKLTDLKVIIGEMGGQGTRNVSLEEQQFRIDQRIVVDSAHDKQHLRFVTTHCFVNDDDIIASNIPDEYIVYHRQPLAMLEIGSAFAQQLLDLRKSDFLEFIDQAEDGKGDREAYQAQFNGLQVTITAVCCVAVVVGAWIGVYVGSNQRNASKVPTEDEDEDDDNSGDSSDEEDHDGFTPEDDVVLEMN